MKLVMNMVRKPFKAGEVIFDISEKSDDLFEYSHEAVNEVEQRVDGRISEHFAALQRLRHGDLDSVERGVAAMAERHCADQQTESELHLEEGLFSLSSWNSGSGRRRLCGCPCQQQAQLQQIPQMPQALREDRAKVAGFDNPFAPSVAASNGAASGGTRGGAEGVAAAVDKMAVPPPPRRPVVAAESLKISGKLQVLLALLMETRIKTPDRFVLISNFTTTLALFEAVLKEHGFSYKKVTR